MKSFKTYIAKICKEEYGHLVMLALFDVVDDTKLVQKAILDVRLYLLNFRCKIIFDECIRLLHYSLLLQSNVKFMTISVVSYV